LKYLIQYLTFFLQSSTFFVNIFNILTNKLEHQRKEHSTFRIQQHIFAIFFFPYIVFFPRLTDVAGDTQSSELAAASRRHSEFAESDRRRAELVVAAHRQEAAVGSR
jgi:hypothetical protein